MKRKIGTKGKSNYSYKHGMSNTRFYKIWLGIKKRVNADAKKRPNDYKNYVMKNITLYNKWYDFINFKNDLYMDYLEACNKYGEKNITIDRIKNTESYIPGNIRWVTRHTQNLNKSDNHIITLDNKSKTVAEWAKEKGLSYGTLSSRITKLSWNPYLAVNTPLKKRNVYIYKGKEYTLKELSKVSKVDSETLRTRIHTLKWLIEDAVEKPNGKTNRNIVITIDGVSKNLSDFCKDYHINYTTVLSRLEKGLSYEEALKKKVKTERMATLNNETKTIKEWCEILNLNYQTVCSRIQKGLSYEEALTQSKNNR